MGTRLIVLGLPWVTKFKAVSGLTGLAGLVEGFQETTRGVKTVPETDTGGLVEHTKALERTMVKELGKLPS
jgi:hypothetical protein